MTYFEKLKDPRWQKRRLELFEAADWTCKECGTKTETLHAHHGCYRKGIEPWDYEDSVMHVLCECCHKEAEACRKSLQEHIGALRPATVNALARALATIPTAELRDGAVYELSQLIHCELPGYEWPSNNSRDLLHWLQQQCIIGIYQEAQHDGWRIGRAAAAREAAKTA